MYRNTEDRVRAITYTTERYTHGQTDIRTAKHARALTTTLPSTIGL